MELVDWRARMERGSKITVVGYRGIEMDRRVWDVADPGVLVCAEDEYQKAVRTGQEPPYSGFPIRDVVHRNSTFSSPEPRAGA